MANRSRYGRKRESSLSTYLWIALGILLTWIFFSIYQEKSPSATLEDVYHKVLGQDSLVSKSPRSWEKDYQSLQAQSDSIQAELTKCLTSSPYKLGKVSIEDDFVNLRDAASLSSNIIQKIPNGSEVNILYFDTKEYIWDGKMGKWCKVQYADLEGWVWGNYIAPQ